MSEDQHSDASLKHQTLEVLIIEVHQALAAPAIPTSEWASLPIMFRRQALIIVHPAIEGETPIGNRIKLSKNSKKKKNNMMSFDSV